MGRAGGSVAAGRQTGPRQLARGRVERPRREEGRRARLGMTLEPLLWLHSIERDRRKSLEHVLIDLALKEGGDTEHSH